MVCVIASCAVDRGLVRRSAGTKDIQLIFAACPLITRHSGVRKNYYARSHDNDASEWTYLLMN